jgi:hypothetical protein
MTEVNPSAAYRLTFFQTFSTDPHVVSTRVHPRPTRVCRSSTVTPNAGRMTTSFGVSASTDSPGSLRNRTPCSRRRSFT